MLSKPRREDVFIEAFLSAYEDESWADSDKDWVDRRTDGGIEVVAKRTSDGKTLAIEHTLIQPFESDKEDFAVFGRSFLKIEDDKSLIVPDRWIRVFVPVGTLLNYPNKTKREVVVNAVHEWIRANRLTLPDGDSDRQCLVSGIPGKPDLDITLTIKVTPLPGHGSLHVRRQQVGNDFPDVVRKALATKLPKLMKQNADKRILMLERQHMNLIPDRMQDEIRKQAPDLPALAQVDEIWVLETIGYEPGGYFLFELNDEKNEPLADIACQGNIWTSRSVKGGIPVCNY